jgi:hypothetical protein
VLAAPAPVYVARPYLDRWLGNRPAAPWDGGSASSIAPMELRRHLQVLWRFRLVIVAGVLFGTVVGILASFHVSFDGGPKLTWRSDQTFESNSTLFVTQNGFPWGRVTLPVTEPGFGAPATDDADKKGSRREYGAPERFSDLAVLYSYLATSQQVRALIAMRAKPEQVAITPVMNPASGTGLPLLKVRTTGKTGAVTQQLNTATVDALRRYLDEEQDRAEIDAGLRVEIQVLNPPSRAVVSEGRSYMGSLIAFILAIGASIGLAYLLENLRPKRPDPAEDDEFDLEESWADITAESSAEPERTVA